MATWVTHLMIADKVMNEIPGLDRRGFCVGNIAPDCNVENKDWTAFTPSREITHWMSGRRKVASDCDVFCDKYIIKRKNEIKSNEEYSFLLGYYAHLITDAAFQKYIRDDERVKSVWNRIKSDTALYERAMGYAENWDSVKLLFPYGERMKEIYAIEAEYLNDNPNTGYMTEIMSLKEFPDYIDYLPQGSIVRKIGVMGYIPKLNKNLANPITISREEFNFFVEDTVKLVIGKFKEMRLM